MSSTCTWWVLCLFGLYGLATAHISSAKDGKTTHISEISKSDTSTGELTSKKQLPKTYRSIGGDLKDIDVLIKQLGSVINQLQQGINQGQSPPEQKEACVTNKKGKLKCKKPPQQSPTGVATGSVQHFQSLHNLFSNVSTSFSSVQNRLLEDMVGLIMQGVVEHTKTLTQQLEERILTLTDTVHTRLDHLEASVLRSIPPDTQPRLTEDNPSDLDTHVPPEPPSLGTNPKPESSKGNDTYGTLSNATLSGYSINLHFTDFIKGYWVCCSLPYHDGKHPAIMSSHGDETRNKTTGDQTEHDWTETSSSIWKFQLGHGIDLLGSVSGVLITVLLVGAVGVVALVLFWREDTDYTPSLINRNAGIYTTSGLTVVTVSTSKSTHSQVKTITERLINSNKKLHFISKTTKFIKIKQTSAMKDDLLDRHGDSEKLLVFIDVSRDEKATLLEVEDELHAQIKALSLEDICAALGDTVIVLYGDSGSRQLPLGAIYNTSVVDKLPVPALRALCRVGRFLTVNTAFTNTQRVLLEHWLQTPAKLLSEEDI